METLNGSTHEEGALAHLREHPVIAVPARAVGTGLRFSEHVRRAYWSAFQNGCTTTAKAAAYSGVFALFPALLVAAACVTLLPQMAPARFELAIFFDRFLPDSVAPLIEDFFINANKSPQSTHVLILAGIVGFSGAAGVLATLMEGLRRAYHLPLTDWTVWQRRVRAYVLLLISFIPVTVASVLVVFGHYITQLFVDWRQPELDTPYYILSGIVRWAVSLGATAAVIAVIYRYGISKKIEWRHVLPGAAFAAATWFLTTLVFGWYVTHFANYSHVYGSLGAGIALMVWMFLTALSVLCGAELNAELFPPEKPESSAQPCVAG